MDFGVHQFGLAGFGKFVEHFLQFSLARGFDRKKIQAQIEEAVAIMDDLYDERVLLCPVCPHLKLIRLA